MHNATITTTINIQYHLLIVSPPIVLWEYRCTPRQYRCLWLTDKSWRKMKVLIMTYAKAKRSVAA